MNDRVAEVRALVRQKHGPIIKDARQVDTKAWAIPEDSHLLRTPAAFRDDVQELFRDRSCKGDGMPANKTRGLLQFRKGEVTLWAGYKESYKSTFLNELFAYWAINRISVAIASLEMPAATLLQKAISQSLANDNPRPDDVDKAIEALTEGLTLYDVTGRIPPNHLLAVIRYCAVELQCRHFLLDNLTMLMSVNNDRADEMQAFISGCTMIAKTTGIHIHLVAHCSKPEGGDESKVPSGYSIRGTGSAPDLVDNVVLVWRNKVKERKIDEDRADDEVRRQADVFVIVDKQRHWPFRGSIRYWLNAKVLRFMEYGNDETLPFI